jgi:putative membrane protein
MSFRNLIIRLLINAVGLVVAANLVSGIDLAPGFLDVVVVAAVFGLVNALIKPIVVVLSFPFLILSLGLMAFVINAGMLLLTSHFTNRLAVDGFVAALLGSLVISVVGVLAGLILGKDD